MEKYSLFFVNFAEALAEPPKKVPRLRLAVCDHQHMSDSTSFDADSVKGNAPEKTKEFLYKLLRRMTVEEDGTQCFSGQIGSRITLTEVSIRPKEVAPKRMEATVVCEMVVEKGQQISF